MFSINSYKWKKIWGNRKHGRAEMVANLKNDGLRVLISFKPLKNHRDFNRIQINFK